MVNFGYILTNHEADQNVCLSVNDLKVQKDFKQIKGDLKKPLTNLFDISHILASWPSDFCGFLCVRYETVHCILFQL